VCARYDNIASKLANQVHKSKQTCVYEKDTYACEQRHQCKWKKTPMHVREKKRHSSVRLFDNIASDLAHHVHTSKDTCVYQKDTYSCGKKKRYYICARYDNIASDLVNQVYTPKKTYAYEEDTYAREKNTYAHLKKTRMHVDKERET